MDAPSYESIEKSKHVDIQIGSMAPEQVKSGTTEQVSLQNEQSNALVKKEDSLAQSKDQVRKNLPPVETDVQKQENVWIKSNSRAEATQRLKENGKFWGDSSLMKKIKQTMNTLNDLLVEQMPREKDSFLRETELRTIRYEKLYLLCEEYVKKRTGTHREPGVTRLKLITEIRDYIGKEKDNFAEHAQKIYQMCQDQEHMPFWTSVLDNARLFQPQSVPEGGTFKEKSTLDEKQTETMKKRAAVSRVARLLNMEDQVENVRSTKVIENGEEKVGFLIEPHKDYFPLSEVKKMLKKPENQEISTSYEPSALRDLTRIRDMDELLGIERGENDLLVRFHEETFKSGKKYVRITNVMAINNDKLFQTPSKYWGDRDKHLDREQTNRLLALSKEIMNGAMLDLLTKAQREDMEERLDRMKWYTSMNSADFQDVVNYSVHGIALRESLFASYKIAALDTKIVDFDQISYFTNSHSRIVPVQPMEHQEELKKLFEGDQVTEISEQWKKVRDAAKGYFDLLEKKVYGQKENAAIKELLEQMRAWEMTARTTEQEQEMFEQYKQKISDVWGSAVFQNENKPLTNPEFDDSMLEGAKYVAKVKKSSEAGELDLEDRSGEPLFTHIPCETDIKQGFVGDCYFLSALAAMAKNSPKSIMEMMKDQGDRVTVTFPTGKSVTVSKKVVSRFEKNGDQIDKTKKIEDWYAHDTLWVQIMEKAYVVAGFRKSERSSFNSRDWSKVENSIECMSGGSTQDVLRDLQGAEFVETEQRLYTVDNMNQIYNTMWDRVLDFQQTDEKKEEQKTSLPENWKAVKSFLVMSLKKPLSKELQYRQQIAFQTKQAAAVETVRAAFRTVTIEDVQDALRDLRNWKTDSEESHYDKIMKQFREKFPDLAVTRELLNRCLEQLGHEFDHASEKEQDSLEHRRQFGAVGEARYTKNAVGTYEQIADALKQNRYVTASTKKFRPMFAVENGAGLNGEEMREGMAQGHAYTVLGCSKRTVKNVTRYYIRLQNPWGTGTLGYGTVKNADGSISYVGNRVDEEADNGIFDLELNDFMQFMRSFKISKQRAKSKG